MKWTIPPTVILMTLTTLTSAAPDGKYLFVDLAPKANMKRADNFGRGGDGNDLKDLGNDSRTLAGVNFKLGESVLQLNSKVLTKQRPTKIEGIKVGNLARKVHILHATGYGNVPPDSPLYIADGTKIAEYKIRYDDGKTAVIPVVYGEDVRDWWFSEGDKGVSRGKLAWQGDNELAKGFNKRLRLFLTTWDNPHPTKKIASIDYAKVGEGPAAPFCVAITLEAK
jgi:hypothetical protein